MKTKILLLIVMLFFVAGCTVAYPNFSDAIPQNSLGFTVSYDLSEFIDEKILQTEIGIETLGGITSPVLQKGTTIPAEESYIFSTAANNQPQIELHIQTGDGFSLGRYAVEGIPLMPRGEPKVEVTFSIKNNSLELEAVEIESNTILNIKQTKVSGEKLINFRMEINDVFHIENGPGPVVVGKVVSGAVEAGDSLTLKKQSGREHEVRVTNIEKFNQTHLPFIEKGSDDVGLTLVGLEYKEDIAAGDMLTHRIDLEKNISIPFKVVSEGSGSGVTNAEEFLISSQEEWENTWKIIEEKRKPKTEAPSVDFFQSQLLALFAGEYGVGGIEIEVTKVEEDKEHLFVYATKHVPGDNCVVTEGFTSPYQIVEIPNISGILPVYFVIVEEESYCRL